MNQRHRVSERMVRIAIESGPLPPIRFHGLRHGAATLSRLAKIDFKRIGADLGHARYSFTADTYTAVVPEIERDAAESVAALVPRRGDGPTMAPPGDKQGVR